MATINYAQVYTKVTKGVSPRVKDIFERRFGIPDKEPKTLEAIGEKFKITRERVRQIEEAGFNFVKKNHPDALKNVFNEFESYFTSQGGFKREDVALDDLGGKNQQPYVRFFLAIGGEKFSRVAAKKDYHYFLTILPNGQKQVTQTLANLVLDIKSYGKLITKDELSANFSSKYNLQEKAVGSYLEISKKIESNKENKLGLVDWPEIRPRGVKDKAFLVFKKHQKPLHFRKITELIDQLEYNHENQKAHPQTVHNELIKDSRFVLVGRGTYALAEWGYVPGTIKDVITKLLKEKQEAMHQDEIIKAVLSQRLVAKNTVMINLNNKNYFQKTTDGKYLLKEVQTV